ncbi:MAG: NERD domain-containing protein [Chloroflexi bacterium]|nr:NERD domain-containing protein [Chloroflexota bacterium]
MKTITNPQLIQRNKKIGQVTIIFSLIVLAIGLYLSFSEQNMNLSLIALLVGIVTSQIGMYYSSRWSRSPRPDEQINQALKGLDDKYSLYHYRTVTSHLLVGPAGVWVLLPYYQSGTITYNEDKSRWVQKGTNVFMRIFAQEGLGRPDVDVNSNVADVQKYIQKILPEQIDLPVRAALVFTSPKVNVKAPEASSPTVTLDKLKDLIRRKAKEEPANEQNIRILQKALPES